MNCVYYKTKVWQRIKFDEGTNMTEVKKIIESGKFFDLFNRDDFVNNEVMFDTEEYLNPEEEDSETLEIYENGELIYVNYGKENNTD